MKILDITIIRKQVELAEDYGIYVWCIYYYWFSGRKLLTKTLDILLENKGIDINFCLQWCSESCSKVWDEDDWQELINGEYREDDLEKFTDDLKKYVDDKKVYLCKWETAYYSL